MILDTIETIIQKSLNESNDRDRTQAVLQSCYYKLNNLKNIINEENPPKNIKKMECGKIASKQPIQNYSDNKLPQISVCNLSRLQNSTILKQNSKNSINNPILENAKPQLSVERKKIQDIKEGIMKKKEQNHSYRTQNDRNIKATSFRTRIKPTPKTILHSLSKQQRYFEDKELIVPEKIVDKIGLYHASHLFKKNNVNKFIDKGYCEKMKPVINLRFASLGVCTKDQLFLTQNSQFNMTNTNESYSDLMSAFEVRSKQPFKIAQVIEEKFTQEAIFQTDEAAEKEEQTHNHPEPQSDQQTISQYYWMITIHNYEIVKNQQFLYLKSKNIEDWGQLSFILYQIINYLKKIKIGHVSFKLEKAKFLKELWACRKINHRQIQELLKIKSNLRNLERKKTEGQTCLHEKDMQSNKKIYNSRQEIISDIMKLWKDRKNLEIKKKNIKKRKDVLQRLALRMLVRYKVKNSIKKKVKRVSDLNSKLVNGLWEADVEIYVGSFSEELFIRNTTQYMETYENMFYHIWSSSAKQIVIILPAINETLLKKFQQKMKMRKNITLICPDSHQIYPNNLPLAAYLLYSKQSILRLRNILQNRKGVLIPGRLNQNNPLVNQKYLFQYEMNLSDLLLIPIYSNLQNFKLKSCLQFGQIHTFSVAENIQEFSNFKIRTPTFKIIRPNSTIDELNDQLSDLIVNNKNSKSWLLKINGEFNGRGIGIFDCFSSKKLRDILLCDHKYLNQTELSQAKSKMISRVREEVKNKVIEYLVTYFRLKVKVNFENCIYRVDEFINKLLKKGGVIQQHLQDCETYEFCYKVYPRRYNNNSNILESQKVCLLAISRNYCVDFVNKASVFNSWADLTPRKQSQIMTFQEQVCSYLKQKEYIGYISVVAVYSNHQNKIFAIENRPFLSINSSMSQFLCWKEIKNSQKQSKKQDQSYWLQRSSLRIEKGASTFRMQGQDNCNNQNEVSSGLNQTLKTYFSDENKIYLFIPTIVFTDVDEITRSQIIENLIIEEEQQQYGEDERNLNQTKESNEKLKDHGIESKYLSLGLSLSILMSGQNSQLRKMKGKTIQKIRNLSEKLDSCKMYRGKQQIRDVYRFGDVIRAITKIK